MKSGPQSSLEQTVLLVTEPTTAEAVLALTERPGDASTGR